MSLTEIQDTISVFKIQHKSSVNSDVSLQNVNTPCEHLSSQSLEVRNAAQPQNDAKDIYREFPNLFADKLGTCRDFKAKFNFTDNARANVMPANPHRNGETSRGRTSMFWTQRDHRTCWIFRLNVANCHRQETQRKDKVVCRFFHQCKSCADPQPTSFTLCWKYYDKT